MRTYYTTLNKERRHIYVDGWIIQLIPYCERQWSKDMKSYRDIQTAARPQIPNTKDFGRKQRAMLKLELAREKRLAQAVQTEDEYNALRRRIEPHVWVYIEAHDLRGEALVHWAHTTPTSEEFARLMFM